HPATSSITLLLIYLPFFFLLLILTLLSSFFFFSCSPPHRYLHSFPTRRSSDLFAISSISFFDIICKRESRLFTVRSEARSINTDLFVFDPTRDATQSSNSRVPRQAIVKPLRRIRRRPSTFANGFRLPSIRLGPLTRETEAPRPRFDDTGPRRLW